MLQLTLRDEDVVAVCVPSPGTCSVGLRLVQQSTLMTAGFYNKPQGAWLPSIVY